MGILGHHASCFCRSSRIRQEKCRQRARLAVAPAACKQAVTAGLSRWFSDALAWMPQTGLELMRMPFQDGILRFLGYIRLAMPASAEDHRASHRNLPLLNDARERHCRLTGVRMDACMRGGNSRCAPRRIWDDILETRRRVDVDGWMER